MCGACVLLCSASMPAPRWHFGLGHGGAWVSGLLEADVLAFWPLRASPLGAWLRRRWGPVCFLSASVLRPRPFGAPSAGAGALVSCRACLLPCVVLCGSRSPEWWGLGLLRCCGSLFAGLRLGSCMLGGWVVSLFGCVVRPCLLSGPLWPRFGASAIGCPGVCLSPWVLLCFVRGFLSSCSVPAPGSGSLFAGPFWSPVTGLWFLRSSVLRVSEFVASVVTALLSKKKKMHRAGVSTLLLRSSLPVGSPHAFRACHSPLPLSDPGCLPRRYCPILAPPP